MSYMSRGYAIAALGEAGSCLAALADTAPAIDESIHFNRLLLLLRLEGLPGLLSRHRHQAGLLDRLC